MGSYTDPWLERRYLGTKLSDARGAAETPLTQKKVAEELEWSLSKVIRIESGDISTKKTDLLALLNLYGVTDTDTIEVLINAARAGRSTPWWHDRRSLVPPALGRALAYEAGAIRARTYGPSLLAPLLQTGEYAAALALHNLANPADRESWGWLLERRQQLWNADPERVLDCVVDEASLLRHVGGPAVMYRQLDHLLAMNQRPAARVRVLPLNAGAHGGLVRGFALMHQARDGSDVAIADTHIASEAIEDGEAVQGYVTVFEQIESLALTQQASSALIEQLQRSYA